MAASESSLSLKSLEEEQSESATPEDRQDPQITAERSTERLRRPPEKDHFTPAQVNIKPKLLEVYLGLLNQTIGDIRDKSTNDDLEPLHSSTISGVSWDSSEKERFFSSLHRYGVHDLPAIAREVQSKSIPEVRQYILALQDGCEQLHEQKVKPVAISSVDNYIAHDIGLEVDILLENISETLESCTHEQLCDAERAEYGDRWIIDQAYIDASKNELLEGDSAASDAKESQGSLHGDSELSGNESKPEMFASEELLHAGMFIRLMRNVFMNCNHDDLLVRSEESEGPSILRSAFETFHDIVLSLTRRLVRAAIMQATMRLRADQDPSTIPTVRALDVSTALDVVGVSRQDRVVYWQNTMRKYKIKVVSKSTSIMNGRRRKTAIPRDGFVLTPDEVYAGLAQHGGDVLSSDDDLYVKQAVSGSQVSHHSDGDEDDSDDATSSTDSDSQSGFDDHDAFNTRFRNAELESKDDNLSSKNIVDELGSNTSDASSNKNTTSEQETTCKDEHDDDARHEEESVGSAKEDELRQAQDDISSLREENKLRRLLKLPMLSTSRNTRRTSSTPYTPVDSSAWQSLDGYRAEWEQPSPASNSSSDEKITRQRYRRSRSQAPQQRSRKRRKTHYVGPSTINSDMEDSQVVTDHEEEHGAMK